MAKTIKFNLKCDNKPIRTLEDLRENFCIEDVISYYENGLLLRWLTVRGFEKEKSAVKAIPDNISRNDLATELVKIFEVENDEKEIQRDVYVLNYVDECEKALNKINTKSKDVLDVLSAYKSGYDKLVTDILDNPDNVSIIKAAVKELSDRYKWLISMDYRYLFWAIKDKSILAIMCMLMDDTFRQYYIPEADSEEGVEDESALNQQTAQQPDAPKSWNILLEMTGSYSKVREMIIANNSPTEEKRSGDESINDCESIYKEIKKMCSAKDFIESLGDNVKVFNGVTDSYWKDLEPKEKKCMIISIGTLDYVRSAGCTGGDKGVDDINDKFEILDGIDYKSDYSSAVIYMEV